MFSAAEETEEAAVISALWLMKGTSVVVKR